jgi:hypothetical protein
LILSYFDFIHNELIHFSHEDVYRSIPNLIDGLKPSQRKVLYGCFKADLDKVKFIKTDTEGYDVDILEELGPIINKTRPFILMEWWPTTEARMAEYFIKNNYVPFNKDNLSLIQNLHISNRVHDIFLIPRELLKSTE